MTDIAAPLASYAERWAALDPETKERLAGSPENAAVLDALAEDVADLDDRTRTSLLKARKRQMRKVVERYRRHESMVESLRSERNLLMIEEAILGEQQQRIAENAEVTAMIVAIAIGTSTKRRGPAAQRKAS